jgi:hypothetical protein
VIELDLNNPEFQDNWLALQRDDAIAVLASLRQIRQIDWRQLQTSTPTTIRLTAEQWALPPPLA